MNLPNTNAFVNGTYHVCRRLFSTFNFARYNCIFFVVVETFGSGRFHVCPAGWTLDYTVCLEAMRGVCELSDWLTHFSIEGGPVYLWMLLAVLSLS